MMQRLKKGVTLIELVIVLVILSLLSTIAVGVYTREVLRAKVTRTRAEIRTLEVAVTRYFIDTGQYPPSGSGTQLAPNPLDPTSPYQGSGYLQVALRSSLSGNFREPLTASWGGPYVEWDENRLGTVNGDPITGSTPLPSISYIDPFGNPYYYINFRDYQTLGGTFLPSSSPFFANETFYNASTFQIVSFGPNGITAAGPNQIGTDVDDITNWAGPIN